LLGARVAYLDRALIREPAVVALLVHDLAALPEPSGQPCVVIACRADRGDASQIRAAEAPVERGDLPSSAEGGASGSVTAEPGTAKDEQTHVLSCQVDHERSHAHARASAVRQEGEFRWGILGRSERYIRRPGKSAPP
jgi:hypothetical protein